MIIYRHTGKRPATGGESINKVKQISIKVPIELYKSILKMMKRMLEEDLNDGRRPTQTDAVLALLKAGAEKLNV